LAACSSSLLWRTTSYAPGKNRQPDGVSILGYRRRDNLLRCLVQARVDHFHARVTKRGRRLGSAIVAVKAGLATTIRSEVRWGRRTSDSTTPNLLLGSIWSWGPVPMEA
jgi:hypothetical protein